MNLSFDQIWDRVIVPLQGKTIYTLDEQQPNNILEATPEYIKRDSRNQSPPQKVPREIIKAVYLYLMEKGEVSRAYINKAFPDRYSSIICTVLAKAPNIGYHLHPLRLFKKNNK